MIDFVFTFLHHLNEEAHTIGGLFQAIPHIALMYICTVLLEELQVGDGERKSISKNHLVI